MTFKNLKYKNKDFFELSFNNKMPICSNYEFLRISQKEKRLKQ